jgi:hypothetical protein
MTCIRSVAQAGLEYLSCGTELLEAKRRQAWVPGRFRLERHPGYLSEGLRMQPFTRAQVVGTELPSSDPLIGWL